MSRKNTNGNTIESAGEKPFVITVDGPAAAGKGTLTRKLAKELGCRRLDSGKLYRAVAKNAEQVWNLKIPQQTQEIADQIDKHLRITSRYLKQIYKDEELNEERVALCASRIAPQKVVRRALAKQQVAYIYSSTQGIVLDGRDMGTVICPEASCKIFLTASPEARAKRRYQEMLNPKMLNPKMLNQKNLDKGMLKKGMLDKGEKASYQETKKRMLARDARDLSRSQAPLRQAKDALIIDSSDLTITQVFAKALEHANDCRKNISKKLPGQTSRVAEQDTVIDGSNFTIPLVFSKVLDYASRLIADTRKAET